MPYIEAGWKYPSSLLYIEAGWKYPSSLLYIEAGWKYPSSLLYIEAGWKYPSSLLLQYGDVKVEPRRGILAIADFLQVGIDEAAVVSIHGQTSPEAHRSVVESCPSLGGGTVRQEEDHLVHRTRFLHAGYVRGGERGK